MHSTTRRVRLRRLLQYSRNWLTERISTTLTPRGCTYARRSHLDICVAGRWWRSIQALSAGSRRELSWVKRLPSLEHPDEGGQSALAGFGFLRILQPIEDR